MAQDKLRLTFGDYLAKGEVVIYSILALLLSITALTAIANAGFPQFTIQPCRLQRRSAPGMLA